MDGRAEHLMDDDAGTGGAVVVATAPEAQRPPRVYVGSGAGELREELRARFLAATLELVAEGVSGPRLVETRYWPIAP